MDEITVSEDLVFDLWMSLFFASSASSNGTNLIFSPYSVISALMMILIGSSGNTQLQLTQVLFGSVSRINGTAEFVKEFGTWNCNLIERNRKSVQIGNFVYSKQRFPFNPNYTQSLEAHLKAKASSMDFASNPGQALEQIYSDVSNATNGLIPKLLTQVDSETLLLLINTVAFQGIWKVEFDANLTEIAGKFWVNPNKTVDTALIKQEGSLFGYYRDAGSGTEAVKLNYFESDISMIIILPPENMTIRSYIRDYLNASTFDTIFNNFGEHILNPLIIPRFKLSLKHNLKEILLKLGVTDAFGSEADFSAMTPGGFAVSEIMQSAVIECNENGTKAAAATVVDYVGFSTGDDDEPKVAQFIANRPFLYSLVSRDYENRGLKQFLFAGVIEDPTV